MDQILLQRSSPSSFSSRCRAGRVCGCLVENCVQIMRIVANSSGNCGQFYPHLRSCKFSPMATGWELISRETTEWFRAWKTGLGGAPVAKVEERCFSQARIEELRRRRGGSALLGRELGCCRQTYYLPKTHPTIPLLFSFLW